MDAYREGNQFVVDFDVPGVEPSSIDLTVEKNVLTVTAERRWQQADGRQVVTAERRQGTFRRRLVFGEAHDLSKVEANYHNGVLTLRIPVAEKAQPRKIEIGSGTAHPIEPEAAAD
jgi:HSP20 family protein